MKRKHLVVTLLLTLVLAVTVGIPTLAQTATPPPTTTPDPNTLVLITGDLDLSSGQIKVGGYVIDLGSVVPPTPLQQGDLVIVTGYLQPDGITIRAVTFELFVEPEGTVTPTITTTPFTATPSPNFTLTPTLVVTASATPLPPTVTPTVTTCDFPNHPVATRIAEAFNVPYDEVIGYHCAGFGFGEITRAYLLAEATGQTARFYLDQRASGLGWGEIVRQTGIHPSDLAPGQVHRGGFGDVTPEAAWTADFDDHGGNGHGNDDGPGHDQDDDHGNDNCPGNSCNAPGHNGDDDDDDHGNGRGNGRGNGGNNGNGNNGNNGNGRGNGNNGNNGNGNGNGRGNGRGNGG